MILQQKNSSTVAKSRDRLEAAEVLIEKLSAHKDISKMSSPLRSSPNKKHSPLYGAILNHESDRVHGTSEHVSLSTNTKSSPVSLSVARTISP